MQNNNSLADKETLLDFLKGHKLAVIATLSTKHQTPESALIAYAEDPELCLYFQTGDTTRKARNLKTNRKVSLVIGLDVDEKATLQYEGSTSKITDPHQIEECKDRFISKKSPTTKAFLDRPGAVFFKATPTWIRLTKYFKNKHPEIIEFKNS